MEITPVTIEENERLARLEEKVDLILKNQEAMAEYCRQDMGAVYQHHRKQDEILATHEQQIKHHECMIERMEKTQQTRDETRPVWYQASAGWFVAIVTLATLFVVVYKG